MLVSPKKVLFLSDLDGTWLSKNPQNRAALDKGVQELRDEFRPRGLELRFGYVTARPPERVAQENLPTPDYTVTFNGGRIDKGLGAVPRAGGGWIKTEPLQEWENLNSATGFQARVAIEQCRELIDNDPQVGLALTTIGQAVGNPAAEDCKFATHLCFNFDGIDLTDAERKDANGNGLADILEPATFEPPAQITRLAESLSAELAEQGMQHKLSPVYLYHGKPYAMFDVSTPMANKGDAVDFLRRREAVEIDNLIVAGDGGNDISMMRDGNGNDDGRRAIIVGADAKLRQAGASLSNGIVQPASMDCSLGVLDGLRRHLASIACEDSKPAQE